MTTENKQTAAYQHHKQEGLLLNANENSRGLPAAVLEEFMEKLPSLQLNRYPDDDCSSLRQAYAAHIGVDPNQILVGNGSDQMLQLLISAFISKDSRLLSLTPDFSMYDFYAASYEGALCKYPILDGNDVHFSLDEFIHQARDLKPDLILFSTPNNPTGMQISNEDLRKLCWAVAPIPVVADEAYVEFAQESALNVLDQTDNLYITRTLSKAYSLAGARVGFLISTKKNIERLRPYKVVYSVNTLSMTLAETVLDHADLFEEMAKKTIQERERLFKEYSSLPGLKVHPSSANFLCAAADPALLEKLKNAMEKEQIMLRWYEGKPYVRITVGTPEENDRVLSVFKTCLEAEETKEKNQA